MRALAIPLVLFVYVATDITANHGESVRGWLSLISSVARSTGLL